MAIALESRMRFLYCLNILVSISSSHQAGCSRRQ